MRKVHVMFLNGQSRTIEVQRGMSLMEALRAAEPEAVLALCGGNCSCGTCHVIVGPEFFPKLPRAQEEEEEMLENLPSFTQTSRLSCQLPTEDLPDGLVLRIPAADL